MFKVNKHNRYHLYDPKCRCHECVSYEVELQAEIKSERNRPVPSLEWTRSITDLTFKS